MALTLGDEVECDKILHNGLIVAVYQVADGFDHAILDVVINLRHEPKVEDGQAAVWSADQVARVRISLHQQYTALHPKQRPATAG